MKKHTKAFLKEWNRPVEKPYLPRTVYNYGSIKWNIIKKKKVNETTFMPADILPKPQRKPSMSYCEMKHEGGYSIISTFEEVKMVTNGWRLFVVWLEIPYIDIYDNNRDFLLKPNGLSRTWVN
jgi:hypothetical protein